MDNALLIESEQLLAAICQKYYPSNVSIICLQSTNQLLLYVFFASQFMLTHTIACVASSCASKLGVNEVYSFATPPVTATSYAEQVAQTARLFATAGVEMLAAFARDVSQFPRYTPNSITAEKYATPQVPLLVLAGTLDPQTPHGLGSWYASKLGRMARRVTVPYAAHGTTNPDDMCVLNMVADYLGAFGKKAANASCLEERNAPDFEGALPDTQATALEWFGTSQLWGS